MNAISTKVYTSTRGHAVIEQANGRSVELSAEQILVVINNLQACYDYCATWKEPTVGEQPSSGIQA